MLTSLTGAELKLLADFTCKDQDRLGLSSLAVYEGGVLAASDGRMGIMRIPVECGNKDPRSTRTLLATIPHGILMACCKATKAKETLSVDPIGALVSPTLGAFREPPTEVGYPNISKVFPEPNRKVEQPINVDARLMGKFMSAIGKVEPLNGFRPVEVHLGGQLEPILARWSTDLAHWYALIMPCRI